MLTPTRDCIHCGAPIGFYRGTRGNWLPGNPDGTPHRCEQYIRTQPRKRRAPRNADLFAAIDFPDLSAVELRGFSSQSRASRGTVLQRRLPQSDEKVSLSADLPHGEHEGNTLGTPRRQQRATQLAEKVPSQSVRARVIKNQTPLLVDRRSSTLVGPSRPSTSSARARVIKNRMPLVVERSARRKADHVDDLPSRGHARVIKNRLPRIVARNRNSQQRSGNADGSEAFTVAPETALSQSRGDTHSRGSARSCDEMLGPISGMSTQTASSYSFGPADANPLAAESLRESVPALNRPSHETLMVRRNPLNTGSGRSEVVRGDGEQDEGHDTAGWVWSPPSPHSGPDTYPLKIGKSRDHTSWVPFITTVSILLAMYGVIILLAL